MVKTPYICAVGEGLYSVNTGEWKAWPPVIDQAKCTKCGICVLYCPVNSIKRVDGKITIILDYCKGCGVCIHECPQKAIAFDKGGEQ